MEKPREGPGYLLLMAEEDKEERRGRKVGLSCFFWRGIIVEKDLQLPMILSMFFNVFHY